MHTLFTGNKKIVDFNYKHMYLHLNFYQQVGFPYFWAFLLFSEIPLLIQYQKNIF